MTRPASNGVPRVVLMCHEDDRIDSEGLAAGLAHSMALVGIVGLRDGLSVRVRRMRYEFRRSGIIGLLDVLAFRVLYRATRARTDATWVAHEVSRLRAQCPADLDAVPRLLAADPNTDEVRRFLHRLEPDLMIARCKILLRPDIFTVPRCGTFVLHPGICPEYRNAHGCFWALVSRDLARVGMTLLRIDCGIDTGAIFLQASYSFDELRESHIVIEYRVVLENLERIRRTLLAVCAGEAQPISTAGRRSALWGQPRLSAYARWRWATRRT